MIRAKRQARPPQHSRFRRGKGMVAKHQLFAVFPEIHGEIAIFVKYRFVQFMALSPNELSLSSESCIAHCAPGINL
jgi:hypothetical protein